jgi:predicted transcriptional regulator
MCFRTQKEIHGGEGMKSVLISIQPKWCELIASGKKTVEVRKTKPKLETPFKVYIYATWNGKSTDILLKEGNTLFVADYRNQSKRASGKVIGEFVCDQIDEIGYSPEMHGKYISDIDDIHYVSCVDFEQMFDYLADGYGYGWHISDLVIYDKPKELSEFWRADKCPYATEDGCTYKYHCFRAGQTKRCGDTLTRPPQSWCYVEEVEQ